MGMFDKDKEFGNRLDQEFALKEKFILWGVEITGDTVSTKLGDAEIARLECSRIGTPDMRFDCTTVASSIVDKGREANDSDFPCVVELRKVKSRFNTQALVIQWVSNYEKGD